MGSGWGAVRKNIRHRFTGFERLRPILAGVLACVALTCLVFAGRDDALSMWARLAIACGLSLPLGVFLLRHLGLAALVAAAPVPGVSLFLAEWPSRAMPFALGCCLGLGLCVSVLIGHAIASSFATQGSTGRSGMARSIDGILIAVFAVLLVPALVCACFVSGHIWLDVAAAGSLVALSVAVTMRLGAAYLAVGEDTISRINRAQESSARLFAPVHAVAHPRFGFSVFGIACVMAALAFFGSRSLQVMPTIGIWPCLLVATAVTASSYALLRDWRHCLALLLSTGLALEVGLWSFARAGVPLTPRSTAVLTVAASIVFALQIFVSREASRDIETEDDSVAAFERSVERNAMPVCVAGIACVAAALPFGLSALTTWVCFCVAVIAAAVSAIVFQPAIAITIESLVPRAATVAARYRLK